MKRIDIQCNELNDYEDLMQMKRKFYNFIRREKRKKKRFLKSQDFSFSSSEIEKFFI